MKILICGSRYYKDFQKIRDYLKNLKQQTKEKITVIEGGAKGADILARKSCKELEIEFKEYKANWKKYGKYAGPKRNQKMLDDNPDIKKVVAFHEDLEKSKGTKNMIKKAKKKNIKVETYK